MALLDALPSRETTGKAGGRSESWPTAARAAPWPRSGRQIGGSQALCAWLPGAGSQKTVGRLASLAKPSRRQPRLAAGCLTGPLTAGQCLTIARLRDPAKWLVPHQLSGTLRPRPPPDSAALICFAYLALHCAGYTDSAHSVPFQSATQFKQPRLAKAGRSSRSGKPSQRRSGHFVPRISRKHGGSGQCGSPQGPSRGSNRRYTPVLADRARRQRGSGKTSRPRGFARPRQAIDASIGPVPPLTLLRRVQADRPDAG